MNAYELADDLENSNGLQYITKVGLVSLSAQTLRQQANRIAELEKCLFQMQNACIDLTKQNSEPVVWIDPKELEDPELTSTAVSKNKMYPQDIPLYTTPQIKELSDEEIQSIWNEGIVGWYATQEESVLKFARAILKKASSK